MRSESGVSGVVLAAGQSSRLGKPKQLLDVFGEPLIRRVVRNAISSKLSEVVLVLGHRAEEIATAAGEWGQRVVINPDYAAGQSTSVRAGLGAIDPSSQAVVFLLGDQPQVGPEVVAAVVDHFRETGAPIVMPTYGGIAANPVLFSAVLFPELARVTGDEGARSVVARHRDRVAKVAVSGRPPPRDVDTEDDYRALIAEMSRNNEPSPPAEREGRAGG